MPDLPGRKFREDREREDLLRGPLADRKVARTVPEFGETFLQVERQRVVDGSPDPCRFQAFPHEVALGDADHELVEDMAFADRTGQDEDVAAESDQVAEKVAVEGRIGDARIGPAVQVRQLRLDYRGLKRIKPEVAADEPVAVSGGFAVDAQSPQLLGLGGVVRHYDPAVAVATEVLGGEERKTAVVPDRAGAPPAVPGAYRLRGVLNDYEAVVPRDLHDGSHLRHLTEEVDGKNRARPARDALLNQGGINVKGCRINVHEDWCGADSANGSGSREEGEGRGDDLVAGSDLLCHERHEQRVGARRHTDAVRAAHITRHRLLACLHGRTQHEALRIDNPGESLVDFGLDGGVLPGKVQQRYFHRVLQTYQHPALPGEAPNAGLPSGNHRMPLYRATIGSCAALVALLLAAALLHGGGEDAFHAIGTEVTPTVEVAGLPAADSPAGRSERADLDRLAGTALLLLLLSSVVVLATVLSLIAAENLSLQGRRAIEVILGAPPARLVGTAARLWLRRIGVATMMGALACAAGVAIMALGAPPGTFFAPPAAWPLAAVPVLVAVLVLVIALLPAATLYRCRRPLSQEAESLHSTDPRPRQFGRVALVTLQICVASAILAGSGLLVAAGNARPQDEAGGPEERGEYLLGAPGPAEPSMDNTIVGLLSPIGDSARDPVRRAALFESALAALDEAPGLAAESLGTPGAWIARGPEVLVLNECGRCSAGGMPHPVHSAQVKHHAVMPGFFAERGLSFVAGRGLGTETVAADRTSVARNGETLRMAGGVVINEAYARAHFQDPPAVGRRVAIGGLGESWYEVVGVVRDRSGRGLGASGSRYSVYYSAVQHPPAQIELVAAVTAASASGVEDSLRIVREALAELPVQELALAGFRSASRELERVYGTAGWLGGGARMAGLLAAIVALAGMIGALRAHVQSRRREMGIRSALGAGPKTLRRMVLREAFRISAVGVGTGLWATTLIVGVVGPPGVRIFSAPLFLAVAAVFVSAAVLAALPGARVAASADPRTAMDG